MGCRRWLTAPTCWQASAAREGVRLRGADAEHDGLRAPPLRAGVDEIAIFRRGLGRVFSARQYQREHRRKPRAVPTRCRAAAPAHRPAVRGYVAAWWSCPYDGRFAPGDRARVADALFSTGFTRSRWGTRSGLGTARQHREDAAAVRNAVPAGAGLQALPRHRGAGAGGTFDASLSLGLRVLRCRRGRPRRLPLCAGGCGERGDGGRGRDTWRRWATRRGWTSARWRPRRRWHGGCAMETLDLEVDARGVAWLRLNPARGAQRDGCRDDRGADRGGGPAGARSSGAGRGADGDGGGRSARAGILAGCARRWPPTRRRGRARRGRWPRCWVRWTGWRSR